MNRSNYKRRYTGNKKRTNTEGSDTGVKVLTIMVLFALIYFIFAGVTGKWIYNYIASPVFNYFGIGTSTQEPVQTNAIQGFSGTSATASPSTDTAKVEKTITISGYTDYMIQMGAYSTQENASTDATTLKGRGAAGYIVAGDKYRLIAASYQTKESAESVKSSLLSNDGLDSLIYEYSVPKLEFKITATQQQITTIEAMFNDYIKLKNELGDLAISVDKSEVDVAGAKTKLDVYKKTVSGYVDNLTSLVKGNDDNNIINGLNTLYTQLNDDIASITSKSYSSSTGISAELKYISVKMTDKYATFLNDITK